MGKPARLMLSPEELLRLHRGRGTAVKRCRAKRCRRPFYARGLCNKHYQQVRKHGRLVLEVGRRRPCKAPRCDRAAELGAYCRRHADQVRRHGRLTPERERLNGFEGCAVRGCKGEHKARGFCAKHARLAAPRRGRKAGG